MSIIGLVLELLRIGLPIADEIMAAANQEMQLSGSAEPPTAAEQAILDAGLIAAHKALQATQQGQQSVDAPSSGPLQEPPGA